MFKIVDKTPLIEDLLELMNIVKDLQAVSALLGWDQETYMPKGGFISKADQISTLDTLAHQYLSSEKAKILAAKIRDYDKEMPFVEKALCNQFLREHDRAVKLPERLVADISLSQSIALENWKKAKSDSNFKEFEPHLKRLIGLTIEQAECLGYEENPYDALLDFYEPDLKSSQLVQIFNKIKDETIPLLKSIRNHDSNIENGFLFQHFPSEKQIELSRYITKKMSFDYEHGRMDISVHPFTTSFSPMDVRITIRTNENDLRPGLFGTIHETGHALYEQGIDAALYRTFLSDGASYGIHESQSLIWENYIARSKEFCIWLIPHLQKFFPDNFHNVLPEELYRAFNKVEPSFIRTESDELTYNMHIILRYEIEHALINKAITVHEVPEYWNNKMETYLGIIPPDDSKGCLQDIHWAGGSFAYFPTYTLGKLYAATIWRTMQNEMPDLKQNIAEGHFHPIRAWLKEKIHKWGKSQAPTEIIQRISGKELNSEDFLEYINEKIRDLRFEI